MTEPWRVLVVEDDPTVASVHCRLVTQMPGFKVIGVATNATQGQVFVRNSRPDLVLLDIGLPGPSGVALLRWIRSQTTPVEVIAVTAASSAITVRSVLHLGALDYLVKPFMPDRLRQALAAFARNITLLQPKELGQDAVDALRASAASDERTLPKDLSRERLGEVREVLVASPAAVTADDVAARIGIARVTARRYLEHLVTANQATVDAVADGPGRPRKTYLSWDPPAISDGAAATAGSRSRSR